jgi:alkaline phosphatase D
MATQVHQTVRYTTILFYMVIGLLASDNLFAQNTTLVDKMIQYHLERPKVKQDILSLPDERIRPFYHGVASGDPLSNRVIIWTRVTPPDNNPPSITVRWKVATDTSLSNVVKFGDFTTNAERDYTVKVDVDGLEPNTVYYYGFVALDRTSQTGRMKTAPLGANAVNHVRVGVVSCSNYPSGYFNAYNTLSRRNDLDVVLHLGDYIYEYATDTTESFIKVSNRIAEPNKEILTLADYRSRYSTYRLDSDLRRLHQQQTFVSVWDDHESANNAYKDGAENHNPGEGEWGTRKSVSKRVYYEWMPIRETADTIIHRSIPIGNLVDIYMLDTRIEGRDKQVFNTGVNAPQASKDSLNNPNRTILGVPQYQWITNRLAQSQARWKLLGNQVMFNPISITPIDTVGMSDTAKLLLPFALPIVSDRFAGDLWSNYPAEQQRMMKFIRDNSIRNVVIATGDFHCGFGMDVSESPEVYNGSNGLAVEFLTPSITSSNFDEILFSTRLPDAFKAFEPLVKASAPSYLRAMYTTMDKNNKHIKYVDFERHGYLVLDFTENKMQGDWFLADTILARSSREIWARGLFTNNGESRLQTAQNPAVGKSNQMTPAPELPPPFLTSVSESNEETWGKAGIVVLSQYPLPANTITTLNYALVNSTRLKISITDIQGKEVAVIQDGEQTSGTYTFVYDCSSLVSGNYRIVFTTTNGTTSRPFVIAR